MLVALLSAAVLSGTFHPASKADVAIADRWLVVFRPAARSEQLELGRGRVVQRWSSALHGALITASERDARWLSEQPGVEGVFQDVRLEAPWSTPLPDCSVGVAQSPLPTGAPQSITCADPDPQNATAVCTDNWGLDRLDGLSVMRDGVYAPPRTGQGVHVFIIDTGLYAQHQEFAGRVGAGTDATGANGGTDDCSSWSHGTHVAAIAVGTRFGVAKGATLHPVRVSGCPLSLALSSLVTAFDWVTQQHMTTIPGPAIASMSINSSLAEFTDPMQPLGVAIQGALTSGVLVIESAGNQAADACTWSTNVPGALIVGGSDEFDTPWERRAGDPNFTGWCPPDCGSNTGSCVSVFAPAAHIVSAWFGMTPSTQNTCRLSGTSMAAPAVAGVAALYLQQNPTSTPAQTKAALLARARPVITQAPSGTTNGLVTVSEGAADLRFGSNIAVDFGSLSLGDTSPGRQVTITSTGSLPLTISGVSIAGFHPADFSVTSSCPSTPLAPMATCSLDLRFSPTMTGTRGATVSLTTNAGVRTLALQGFGREPQVDVVLTGAGSGRVSSMPGGIDCGVLCSMTFTLQTNVLLTAVADPGSVFAGFSGPMGCGVNATCAFPASGALRVSAAFDRLPVEPDAGAIDAGQVVMDAGLMRDAGALVIDAGARFDAGVPAGADAGPEPMMIEATGKCGCSSAPMLLPVLLLALRRRR
ncbi:MAG: S8 family serine peptidase [Myxococcaceae bacterium]